MKVQRILLKRRDEIIVMVQERGVESLVGGQAVWLNLDCAMPHVYKQSKF